VNNELGRLVNNESAKDLNGNYLDDIEVFSCRLPGVTEETHKKV
jgi:hypothetical protein